MYMPRRSLAQYGYRSARFTITLTVRDYDRLVVEADRAGVNVGQLADRILAEYASHLRDADAGWQEAIAVNADLERKGASR
jgi:hypothetical protein